MLLAQLAFLMLFNQLSLAQHQLKKESLWQAARRGNLEQVKQLIDSGVDVDAPTAYDATALSFAADRGHEEVALYLLRAGADPNVRDSFYKATPMTWAVKGEHFKIIRELIVAGATDVDRALAKAIAKEKVDLIKLVAECGHASRHALRSNLSKAKSAKQVETVEILESALGTQFPPVEISAKQLARFAGVYQASDGETLRVSVVDDSLTISASSGKSSRVEADSLTAFSDASSKIVFSAPDVTPASMTRTLSNTTKLFRRLTEAEATRIPKSSPATTPTEEIKGSFPPSSAESRASDLEVSGPNWAQFRGNGARGVADGQSPPVSWNADENQNLAWKTRIPGLGHSCPVIWGKKVFVTTAISENETKIRTGLYGDVASVKDNSVHEFVTYCFDASTGKVIWQETACKTVPSVKRHLKSTHANSTVATDGRFVVSWFGSEGIYCYTMDGQLVWEKQLGLLDSGWFYDREYQWQFGASPIIHDDKLILQCDIQDQSFISALDITTGNELWRTERDEIPSWSTPTVVDTPLGLHVVTNATKFARSYDLTSGKEIWRIGGNSEIAVPTPISARGLIFVSSGYRPIQPVYAIRLDASGDLTLAKGEDESEFVAWSKSKGGPYMPTPLIYGDYLYVCTNSGILSCFQARTGKLVYKKRLSMKTSRSFVGSPVASDGNLYFTNEEGETLVVRAGPQFEEVSHCYCGEACLTTPAISKGAFFIRAQEHLFAFRKSPPQD